MYVNVVLPVPLQGTFTYRLPANLHGQVVAGCRVIVPFGNKKVTTALVTEVYDGEPRIARQPLRPSSNPQQLTSPTGESQGASLGAGITIKDVTAVVDSAPIILPYQLHYWQWIADYYLCSLGEVFKAALPAPLKKAAKPPVAPRRGASVDSKKASVQLPSALSTASTVPIQLFSPSLDAPHRGATGGWGGSLASIGALPALSPAQQTAFDSIHSQWEQHATCLLHGVTSSGKTEIYIHLIAEAIARGKQVLYLLPEIVLTSQLTDRLRAVFGDRLGVYHSKYSDRQRTEVWQRQLSAEPYDIIVGVRSSVFLPFQRLGTVIVDEEHETNFKQQDPAPRYNARNVALMLANHFKAHTLLGTATPSLESYYNARRGKYGLVSLNERYGQVSLPRVEVVDIKEAQRKRQMSGPFSSRLLEAMSEALGSGQQVILFQNRRGFAPQVECRVCGWTPRCPHCDVSLTLHKRTSRMTCHYCGYTTDIPARCPACENDKLQGRGFGTERIEDGIRKEFPEARIARMDLDTTTTRNAYERIIADFASGATDVLVGTQMVTKGLDFEHVSVVGILSAETMLNQPDFRAYERAFQMMSQVAGRAGRRDRQGLVVLQTRNADAPIIAQIIASDYDAMYQTQMQERRDFGYPPFLRIISVYVKHRDVMVVEHLARELTVSLRASFGTRVLGPDEPPVGRIQSLYIRRIMLKLEPALPLAQVHQLLSTARSAMLVQREYASAHIYFDVDPV